ncbi:MAG: diguanylate cyclase [Phycisphaeraceae bacterium]
MTDSPGIQMPAPSCPVGWRVLLVEGDQTEVTAWAESLRVARPNWTVRTAMTIEEALILGQDADLVISALTLPDGEGVELVDGWELLRRDVPVVILANNDESHHASDVIRDGAYDFVVRTDHIADLLPTIIEKNIQQHNIRQDNHNLQAQLRTTLTQVRLKNQQLEEAVSKLETVAATDHLTGLANRRALGEALERGVAEAQRYGRDIACLMMDLNDFKQLNDTAGHAFGDLVLRELARVLRANSRRSDCAGRLGGDEFVLLMPETELSTAEAVAERIQTEFALACRAQMLRHGHHIDTGVSTGVATLYGSGSRNGEQLLARADAALYAHKRQHHGDRIIRHNITPPDTLRYTGDDQPTV